MAAVQLPDESAYSARALPDRQPGPAGITAQWQAIREELSLSVPHLDSYPLPQPALANEIGNSLFNSERDYLEQVEAYKEFQGKVS